MIGKCQLLKGLTLNCVLKDNSNFLCLKEVDNLAEKFGLGLRSLGLNSGSKISMFSETRAEWMISCLGAFSQVSHC